MSPAEIRGLFERIAADLRRLAEERLRAGDPAAALELAEMAARAERQAEAAAEVH